MRIEVNPEKGAVISGLRALLAEKFPQPKARTGGGVKVKIGKEKELEFHQGMVTEACGSGGSGALLVDAMLQTAWKNQSPMALVDGADSYDPVGLSERLQRLLWVPCKEAASAVKVTDMLLRDGNLPLVVLDLQMNPLDDLCRIPSSTWYRFQRIMEQSTAVFVVLTPKPMINSASERLHFQQRWSLEAMRHPRNRLNLEVLVEHRRPQFGEGDHSMERHIA